MKPYILWLENWKTFLAAENLYPNCVYLNEGVPSVQCKKAWMEWKQNAMNKYGLLFTFVNQELQSI